MILAAIDAPGVNTAMCRSPPRLGVRWRREISRADTDLRHCLGALPPLDLLPAMLSKTPPPMSSSNCSSRPPDVVANAADFLRGDGRIFVKGAEDKSVTVADVARGRLFRHNGAPIVGSGSFDADSVLPDSTRFGNESGAYNYGVQAAQVHVDPQTGQVKVLQMVVASDCGTVIYPIGAEGQVEGGLAQGGYALTEVADRRRPALNPNFRRSNSLHARRPPLRCFRRIPIPTGPFVARIGDLTWTHGGGYITPLRRRRRRVKRAITPEKFLAASRKK